MEKFKKYYIDVYFSGRQQEEIVAESEEKAIEIAKETVKRRANSHHFDNFEVECECYDEENARDSAEYGDMVYDEIIELDLSED